MKLVWLHQQQLFCCIVIIPQPPTSNSQVKGMLVHVLMCGATELLYLLQSRAAAFHPTKTPPAYPKFKTFCALHCMN
jgi:hypothetical protein